MDIDGWLRGIGLPQYAEMFRANDIEGELLGRLTNDDLKDIGVASFGHRKKLLEAIAELGGAPAATPASPPIVSVPILTTVAPPPISTSVEATGERRYLTVMFCDLVDSTGISARLDAEEWRDLVGAYIDAASAAVTEMGGHVAKKLGDGLMCLFGYPLAHENDAERAARAALSIQRALAELSRKNVGTGKPELAARIGLETGPAVVDAAGEIYGDVANIAARVQALAEPGTVLVTARVQRQVAGLFVAEECGTHTLKGVPEPTALFRLVRASGGGRRSGQRNLTPLVGRDDEMTMLLRRWERARLGDGQLVMIVGEPGLGKSRLIEEFHARLSDTPHTWVEWSCSQLLQNTPLHPIAEWGRQRFGSADVPAERRLADLESSLAQVKLDPAENASLLAPLLDIPLPQGRTAFLAPEELRRRQLAALTNWVMAGAKVQPVVLAFEDLHWADPTTLDVLRGIAERGALAPLLIVATTRPEFRPPWGMRSHHGTLSLAPLDRAHVRDMVAELSARHALPQDVIEGVAARTGGVPLFVEEVTRLLLERGAQGGIETIPPTLQQSLMARLDRLGPAREVAQIGSVIGRGFSYGLLRDVAGMDDAPLQAALEKLAEADIVLVQGLPPDSDYRFKHALIQDAAYENLLKSRRQVLHRRVAELLRDRFTDTAAAEPEALAYHFTQAGLTDAAIEWWGKAGDQALRRSAFQEAISHLGRAIEMADKAGDAVRRPGAEAGSARQRVKLQTSYGQAMMLSRGFAATETRAAFTRAKELSAGTDDAAELFPTYYGLWISSITRGEMRLGRETAEIFLYKAKAAGRMTETAVACRILGMTCLWEGHFLEERTHLEEALKIYDPERDREAKFRFGMDTGVCATIYLAQACWLLGDIGRARELIEDGGARAAEFAHVPTRTNAYFFRAIFDIFRDDAAAAQCAAKAVVELSREHGLSLYETYGTVYLSWARARLGDRETGVTDLRAAVAAYKDQGNKLYVPFFQALLADIEADSDADGALTSIDQALALAGETGEHWTDAFLHRIRGEILWKRDPANLAPAEQAFLTAIAVAQEQKARSFELRATLSLAKLYQSAGRPADARAVLARAVEGFSPTPEFPEIEQAQALLAALAATDEVKKAATSRQRRLELQTSYANALIHARGHGARETSAAFAKVQALAAGVEDAADERFSAYYGLWVGSLNRCEPTTMQETAATFLREAKHHPDSPEAGVAHRICGLTRLYFGDYPGAKAHIEKALDILKSERDRDLAFRFGQDQVAAAMIYLAWVIWSLGDVEGARRLADQAAAQAANSGNVPTLVYVKYHLCMFEAVRRDRQRALPVAEAVLEVARERSMPIWESAGRFLHGWANWPVGNRQVELAEMRRGIELWRELGQAFHRPYLSALLAEAEADAGNPEAALSILDAVLAEAASTDQRWSDAELHRIRGEILLKRDPANTAPAEEALLTAIAVAREQKARSFELRAALSLARLYQSANRPADAYSELAPALDGFSPTPELPEIEEAQTLLNVLAQSDEIKTETARRQRRFRLQSAYSNALLHGRGMSPPETTAAFAKARELAASIENPAERFSAYYGLWVGPFIRGNLAQMREVAEAFMRDVERWPTSPEAGIAHRLLGTTCWYAGDYAGAQLRLDQALAVYDHERDLHLSSTFAYDHGVAAKFYLGITLYALGEIDRGARLVEDSLRLALQGGHIPTVALARHYMVVFAAVRRDLDRATPHAQALLDLGLMHGLPSWLGFAKFSLAWAGRRDNPQALAEMRAALSLQRDMDFRVEQPLFGTLLAEAEAAADHLDAGLSTVDEQLAAIEQTGERWFEAEVHRVRGEILLKYDPASTAPAEDAFLKAIAVAREQKARSFELRAAASMARLWRDQGKRNKARGLLAPVYGWFTEGFDTLDLRDAKALLDELRG